MVKARRKIGLLGGTFDPPHLAHLILAQTALEQLKLHTVWFLPAFLPPHKRGRKITPFAHRLRMVRLAVFGPDPTTPFQRTFEGVPGH